MNRRLSALLFLCVVLAASSEAGAHKLPIKRNLIIQVHPGYVETLMLYSEPPGPRTEQLMALYDTNHDGHLDANETMLLDRPMVRRAYLGVDLSFINAKAAKKSPEVRYKRDRSGGIDAAVYRRIDIVPSGDEMSIRVALVKTKGNVDLDVVVEMADGWKFVASDEKQQRLKLVRGGSHTFALTRPAPPPADPKTPKDQQWEPPLPHEPTRKQEKALPPAK